MSPRRRARRRERRVAGCLASHDVLLNGERNLVLWFWRPTCPRALRRMGSGRRAPVQIATNVVATAQRQVHDERLGALLPAVPGTVQVSTLSLRAASRRRPCFRVTSYPREVTLADLVVEDPWPPAVNDWARDVHGSNR